MTREEVQKRAHEAHHKWRYSTVDFRDAVDVMTDFAISIMIEAEDKAWEAARMHDESMLPGRVTTSFVYETINDWRKEKR